VRRVPLEGRGFKRRQALADAICRDDSTLSLVSLEGIPQCGSHILEAPSEPEDLGEVLPGIPLNQ
jgi:hypothetical protein